MHLRTRNANNNHTSPQGRSLSQGVRFSVQTISRGNTPRSIERAVPDACFKEVSRISFSFRKPANVPDLPALVAANATSGVDDTDELMNCNEAHDKPDNELIKPFHNVSTLAASDICDETTKTTFFNFVPRLLKPNPQLGSDW